MTDYSTPLRPHNAFDPSDQRGRFPGWFSPRGRTPVCHCYSRRSERHNIQWNCSYRLMAITSFARSSATQHCPFWFISIRHWSSLTLIWIKTPEKTCQGKPISGQTFNSVWHWCAETHINALTDQIKQCSARHCWGFSKGQCIFLSIWHVI